MKVLPIASSSSGNATLIFNDNTHILIDAGVAAKKILEASGRKSFDALFISHSHGDHISGAGPLGRKTKVPIYINEIEYKSKENEFTSCIIKYIDETSVITIGDFIVKPFSVKHDSKHPLGFVIEEPSTSTKLAYITDSGAISKTMRLATKECNAVYIEADYDVDLLEKYSEYDQFLKDRISSNFGHLSNEQALEYISTYDINILKAVIIGHISERTNTPEKIMEHVKAKFPGYENKFKIAPFTCEIIV